MVVASGDCWRWAQMVIANDIYKLRLLMAIASGDCSQGNDLGLHLLEASDSSLCISSCLHVARATADAPSSSNSAALIDADNSSSDFAPPFCSFDVIQPDAPYLAIVTSMPSSLLARRMQPCM